MKHIVVSISTFLAGTYLVCAQEGEIEKAKTLFQYIQDKSPWSYVAIGISVIVFAVLLNAIAKLFKGKKTEEE